MCVLQAHPPRLFWRKPCSCHRWAPHNDIQRPHLSTPGRSYGCFHRAWLILTNWSCSFQAWSKRYNTEIKMNLRHFKWNINTSFVYNRTHLKSWCPNRVFKYQTFTPGVSNSFYNTDWLRFEKNLVGRGSINLYCYQHVEVDSSLVISERICTVNAALENFFFYFHFLYDWRSDVHWHNYCAKFAHCLCDIHHGLKQKYFQY